MTAGQIFYGGLALLAGIGMALTAREALRTGSVFINDSPFGTPASRENQPALYWLVVVAMIIGAVVAIVAGACAFLLWGPRE
jgi:hypothetical protein